MNVGGEGGHLCEGGCRGVICVKVGGGGSSV